MWEVWPENGDEETNIQVNQTPEYETEQTETVKWQRLTNCYLF